eukprot:TRINITY_DN23483_c0_g4_i1.p1 TRINITY_DN23483_c0_g4~~TRINITY_DN23483_c0_g4_i1.p1  ORF type:complete len:477 (+),score=77.92 TRINITY_DN23483_c0_g4_i1:35-1432(+)
MGSVFGGVIGGSDVAHTQAGGFRVFKVTPGGPASEAGLEVFFDFIVDIDGVKMDADQMTFYRKVADGENVGTRMKVYNIRNHAAREVQVVPRKWSGAGLLGAVVRYDALENAENQGIRVLSVFPNSPAEKAGLIALKDYLLGTTEVMFRDLDELIEIVNLCIGRSMQVWVYNSETESIREVTLTPNFGWGGQGAIGADIRTGLLHRIPAPRRKPVAKTGDEQQATSASAFASDSSALPGEVVAPLASVTDASAMHVVPAAETLDLVDARPAQTEAPAVAEVHVHTPQDASSGLGMESSQTQQAAIAAVDALPIAPSPPPGPAPPYAAQPGQQVDSMAAHAVAPMPPPGPVPSWATHHGDMASVAVSPPPGPVPAGTDKVQLDMYPCSTSGASSDATVLNPIKPLQPSGPAPAAADGHAVMYNSAEVPADAQFDLYPRITSTPASDARSAGVVVDAIPAEARAPII